MILPETYSTVLLFLILSMICWGSWASTYKASHARFELYYFDFAFGLVAVAALAAFTIGSLGFDGFTFLDDLLHAGKRAWFYAFIAGVIFNLGNMLLMAAVAVGGMSVSFPMSAGLALIIGVIAGRFEKSAGNLLLTFAGCGLVFGAILTAAAAYRFINVIRHEAIARAGKAKSTRRPAAVKGIVLSLASGILLSGSFPLVAKAKESEIGLGPYSVCALFAAGVLISTFIYNLFFMNLPVEGEPVDFMEYFKEKPIIHGWGFLGGVLWGAGFLSALVAASSDNVRMSPALSYGFGQAAVLIAILWGTLVWKEFKDGDTRAKSIIGLTFLLFAVGIILVSAAQSLSLRNA